MKLVFISNYINHHQAPFCDACYEALGDGFTFIQTMPMEKERVNMGWGAELNERPYIVNAYGEPERAEKLFVEADIALVGWAEREDLVEKRMRDNRPVIRVSERIYREGRWKFISPRGLYNKYREHGRYRDKKMWLLAVGAYTASDFALIGAYRDKVFTWGYFPAFEDFDADEVFLKRRERECVKILWAGRFMGLKHPDHALFAAKLLSASGAEFELTMVGDGPGRGAFEEYCEKNNIADRVEFTGFLTPEETRERELASDILLFTSDHREGWGAVVSEAMSAGLAVVASDRAGGPASLMKNGVNGFLYGSNDRQAMYGRLSELVWDGELRERLGRAALDTMRNEWSAKRAAGELLKFCEAVLEDRAESFEAPLTGPMSRDRVIRPYKAAESGGVK